MNAPNSTAERIRELNDAFRTGLSAGDWMRTCNVRAFGVGPPLMHWRCTGWTTTGKCLAMFLVCSREMILPYG